MDKTDHTPNSFNPREYRDNLSLKRRVLDSLVYPYTISLYSQLKTITNPEIRSISFSYDQPD